MGNHKPWQAIAATMAVVAAALVIAGAPAGGQAELDTATTIAGIDDANAVSMQLDSAGRPVVAYHDDANGDLRLLRCDTAACTGPQTSVLLDSAGDVGSALSLALDADDFPVVAYYDATNGDLKIVRCTTVRCSDSPEPVVADSTGDVGNWPSLELAMDSTPVVAYHDATFGDLKVLTCRELDCSGSVLLDPPARTTVRRVTDLDVGGIDGLYPALTLNGRDWPVISYYSVDLAPPDDPGSPGALVLLRCPNTNCQGDFSDIPNAVVDFTGDGPVTSDIALAARNRPVVAYHHPGESELRVARCATVNCVRAVGDTFEVTATVAAPDPSSGVHGLDPSLAISSLDRPVVAYRFAAGGDLAVLHCTNADCSGPQGPTRPDLAGDVGLDPSMDLDGRGNPIVVHLDAAGGQARLVTCTNPAGCGSRDVDLDGTANATDNCPETPNPDQSDIDRDGIGDACDPTTEPSAGLFRIGRGLGPLNVVVGTRGDDTLRGTAGNDVIVGLGGDDIIDGRGGRDCIIAGRGADLVTGGRGGDRIDLGGGNDVAAGGGGNDRILAKAGRDDVVGDAGNDRLFGHKANDTLAGGPGNDRLVGGPGRDRCDGGPGSDRLVTCE